MTILNGASGNDDLQVTSDVTAVNGNGGTDTIHFDQNASSAVTVDLINGTASVAGWADGTITLSGITNIYGGYVGGSLTGNADTTYIVAPGGDTTVDATASGGATVVLGYGNDTVRSGAGNDEIYSGNGSNIIDGGGGYNGVSYINSATYVTVDLYDTSTGGSGSGTHDNGVHDALTNITNAQGGNQGSTLLGTWQDNIFVGGTGNDYIDGRGGNDIMTGGGGANTFIMDTVASAGALTANDEIKDFDTATDIIDVSGFFSSFAQVQAAMTELTEVGNHQIDTVIRLGSGSQLTLDNVSANSLTAADFSFTPIASPGGGSGGGDGSGGAGGGGDSHTGPTTVAADFNGDGMGDMFWQNTVNGLTSAWELNGSSATGVSLANASGWKVMDTGNFEGGAYSGDMLLRNTTTGMVDIWQDNNGVLTGHDVAQATLDWQIMGTADFNGDGMSDILWRNEQNGYVSVWQMNGTNVATTYNPGVVGLQWHVIGAGDYVGDGKAEVLWRDSGTGEVNLWTIDGPSANQTHGQTVAFLPLEWTAVGQGDFNGDGRQDVLWHDNATGQVNIWEMNGPDVIASQTVANLGAQWKVVDVVDANGDGNADIIWRDSGTGQAVLWDMNGFNVIHTAVLGTVDNTWQPINHHYDWI